LDDYRIEVQNFTSCSLDRIEKFKGQTVKIAAIVTTANHRISRKGTGWGLFTIQDYNTSLEFPLFSEDYQKFKHLLEVGEVLYIEGFLQKRYNSEEYQLKLQKVNQLASIGEKLTQSITLKLPIDRLSDELVESIDQLCKNHKGKHKLKMTLLDRTNEISMSMVSKVRKVRADNDFIKALDKLGVAYSVN